MYSSLRVVTPPTSEPVSLDDAKAHLRVDNPDEDGLISGLITAARWLTESYLNRSIVTQTLLWTMSDEPPSGALPVLPIPLLIVPVFLSAPQLLSKPLELPRSPVQSIVSVSQTDRDGNVLTLDASEYHADLAIEPARIRMNWPVTPRQMQHIQVQFIAGYDDAIGPIPTPILLAMKLWVAWLYEHRGDAADASGKPPLAIDYLLAPYRIMFFG